MKVYIIGRGPSLANLRREHIGEGIVIALNEAIVAVDELHLDNPTISLQNDGICVQTPALRITHDHHEKSGLAFNSVLLGLGGCWSFVARVAIAIAKPLATEIVLVCCDSVTVEDNRSWSQDGIRYEGDDADAASSYAGNREHVLRDLEAFPHSFITP